MPICRARSCLSWGGGHYSREVRESLPPNVARTALAGRVDRLCELVIQRTSADPLDNTLNTVPSSPQTGTEVPEVPEVVIQRLPQYLRALSNLQREGQDVISSQQLGGLLHVTPAQIRKDLSYFGRFGKQGRGYNIRYLLERLRHILGLERTWNVAVVGVGRLGRAIISYQGFQPEGFRVVCAFDADPNLIGQTAGGLMIHDIANIREVLAGESVQIAIVSVPASEAQAVIDHLVEAKIEAVLSYAPMAAHVPSNVHIRSVDPVLELQSMTYYLRAPD